MGGISKNAPCGPTQTHGRARSIHAKVARDSRPPPGCSRQSGCGPCTQKPGRCRSPLYLSRKWGPQWPMITWMEWCAILFSHYTPDWFIQQTDVSQSKYCTPDRHSGTETPRMNVDSTHFHGHSFTCLAERLPFLNICGTVKNIDHQIAELGCTQFRVRSVSC